MDSDAFVSFKLKNQIQCAKQIEAWCHRFLQTTTFNSGAVCDSEATWLQSWNGKKMGRPYRKVSTAVLRQTREWFRFSRSRLNWIAKDGNLHARLISKASTCWYQGLERQKVPLWPTTFLRMNTFGNRLCCTLQVRT